MSIYDPFDALMIADPIDDCCSEFLSLSWWNKANKVLILPILAGHLRSGNYGPVDIPREFTVALFMGLW